MQDLTSEDPQWIGGYRLLGRLGAGGMGRVYLARSEGGRTVAVKLVQGELADQAEFRERFRHEVAAARRVGGRWTAPVLDADTEAPRPWVATGYIPGPSLLEVVKDLHGRLPEQSVRVLASGLVRALNDIHGAGIVHRDLKPSNILVTLDGPRVIDFGIARALETVAGGQLTSTGAVIGSPGFMSPEQVRGHRVTAASDVFCLGSVLAYAATGRMPFGSAESGMHALMFRIVSEEPDLDGLPPGPMRDLIAGCLAKDPEQRPGMPELLELTGSFTDGSRAWLPAELTAWLGQHAARLLDAELPQPLPAHPPAPHEHGHPAAPDGHPAAPGGTMRLRPTTAAPGPGAGFGPGPGPGFGPNSGSGPSSWPGWGPNSSGPSGSSGAGSHSGQTTRPRPVPKSPRGLSTWLVLTLCLTTLGSIVTLQYDFALYGELMDVTSSAVPSAQQPAEFKALKKDGGGAPVWADVLVFLFALPTVVLWLCWFRRVRLNAEAFAPRGHRLGRGWALGSWFVPVAHLWIPMQITHDIWKASLPPEEAETPSSHRGQGRRRRSTGPSRRLLHLWWAAWAAQLAIMYFSKSWLTWDTAADAKTARSVLAFTLAGEVLALIAAVLAVMVVQRLSAMQDSRLAPPETQLPYGAEPFGAAPSPYGSGGVHSS
ncbi:DUF4328 domain-containing protein [Streptomyces sp. NA04227]|uniref:protein kinase domain-containing protein n=1 Tax=Streptomyces sp. NA04227 TaxID=2742136 RepID=UPI001590065F|nr:DUF4328 domain-containing protein [Streptomyces sp. NA04227]QKW07236.1 DUF4328 domain-containing protein [Streptomyces sp. NA04227]